MSDFISNKLRMQQHSHSSSNPQHCLHQGQKKIEKYIFSLKKMLGKGSYANVYLGRSIQDNQQVAVKVIDKKIFANKYNLKNIQSEIDIMKKIEHPNIVKLHDVYQTNNNMYIVTEYCRGGDLHCLLKKQKKLKEFEAVKFLKDIVLGFQYLLRNGIVHRDLKPANLLLSTGNVCKISDFGFARNLQYGSQTVLNSIVGTPLYMSPQILKHQSYSNKSDLWSVGLIFYEMLHGQTPWIASNELQLINNIYNRPLRIDHHLSEKAKDFIKRALKIKEDQRMSWEQAFKHDIVHERSQKRQMTKAHGFDKFNKSIERVFDSPLQNECQQTSHKVDERQQQKNKQKNQEKYDRLQQINNKENYQPLNRNKQKANDIFRKLRLDENFELNKNLRRSPYERNQNWNLNFATPQNLTPKRQSSKQKKSRSLKRTNPQQPHNSSKSPISHTKIREKDTSMLSNVAGKTPKRFQRNTNARHYDLTPERKSPWRFTPLAKDQRQ